MDHRGAKPAPRNTGFPRARGDGPSLFTVIVLDSRFPPRTRGWTPCAPLSRSVFRVSPAHAGMDPYTAPTEPTLSSFPRARGDGPPCSPIHRERNKFPPRTRGWTLALKPGKRMLIVSPAHAGMDLILAMLGNLYVRFPRARGDGPIIIPFPFLPPSFPPRTRGWTLSSQLLCVFRAVSPAHAGMDPPDK